jgi:hypothetical protein
MHNTMSYSYNLKVLKAIWDLGLVASKCWPASWHADLVGSVDAQHA